MHTDVGGGYPEQELSDIALTWMTTKGQQHGLRIHREGEVSPDSNGMMHDSRGTWLTSMFRQQQRTWNCETHGKPVIHQSVLKRTLNQNNEESTAYKPWILDLEYDVEDDDSEYN